MWYLDILSSSSNFYSLWFWCWVHKTHKKNQFSLCVITPYPLCLRVVSCCFRVLSLLTIPCRLFLGRGARSTLLLLCSCSHLDKQNYSIERFWYVNDSGLQMHKTWLYSCIHAGRLLIDCPWQHVRCVKRPPVAGRTTPAWLMHAI